jgi:hypothetical protein
MKTEACKNCKKEVPHLYRGYCATCFYTCAICEKCQEWHKAVENREWGDLSYHEPAEHFEFSFEEIGGTTALRLECPDCRMDFRHSFGWGVEALKRDEGVNEGTIIIAREVSE